MPIAQGNCPNCGAPIEFAVGASLAKVCEFCRHTVVRSDRSLSTLGKVADLAATPSLIAVGDEGTLGGRPIRVMGRVQLDYGKGPWDEYYVALDHGQSWGWLAYAQGQWFATALAPGIPTPDYPELHVELDLPLGSAGNFRVAELRSARVVSTEGELPQAYPEGLIRYYADLWGQNQGFATLDYGERQTAAEVFLGWAFPESAFSITALGPRSINKVKVTALKCPNCGGDVPSLLPDRSERLGCPYCGAISDIVERKVIALQERARVMPVVPIGSRGTLDGVEYVCIATLRRGSDFEGELYEWEEFLLHSQGVGFRWLVLDPETGWSFVSPANLAELDLYEMPRSVGYRNHRFRRRNQSSARVTYVLGEVYWKCEVGETVGVTDFASGRDVLSREESPGEVNWSYAAPMSWPAVASAFSLPLAKHAKSGSQRVSVTAIVLVAVVLLALLLCALMASSEQSGGSSGAGSYGVFRGGGTYYGGK